MSYEPTVWQAGDTVTSAKLNKLEQGVASAGSGGIMIVTETDGTLDKTWKEIHDALATGTIVSIPRTTMGGVWVFIVGEASHLEGQYSIYQIGSEMATYITDSENGYPSTEQPK